MSARGKEEGEGPSAGFPLVRLWKERRPQKRGAAGSVLRRWLEDGEPWYFAIGLANLVVGTSSILIPLMISQVLHRTVADLGVLSSLVSLVGVVGSLIWGGLSDVAHRRKPFVVTSFVALFFGFAAIAFAPSFLALLVGNMALNFFWVANAAVSVLIVTENAEKALWEKRIGRLNQTGAIGWVAGLLLGSLALGTTTRALGEADSIRALFLLLALGGAGAALLARHLVPWTTSRPAPRRFRGVIVALGNFLVEVARFSPYHLYHRLSPRHLPALLFGKEGLRRETKRFLVATLLAFTAGGFFAVPLPLLLAERFGLPSSVVFLYFVAMNAGVVLAYPWASRRIDRLGNKVVQMGALGARCLLFSIAAVFLSLSRTVPPAIVLILYFFLIGITWSFFQLSGVALTSRLAKPQFRSQALGLYNAAAGTGVILAGVASGYLAHQAGYAATFAAAAFLMVVALLVLRRLPAPPAVTPLILPVRREEEERPAESSAPRA